LEAALSAGELLNQIKTTVASTPSTKSPLPPVRKTTPSKKSTPSSRGKHMVSSSHKVHPPPLRAMRPLLNPPPPFIEPLDEHEDYSEDMNHQHDPMEDPFAEVADEEAAAEDDEDSTRARATARSNVTGGGGGGGGDGGGGDSPGRVRYNPLSGRLFLDATVPAVARALARQPPHKAPWLRLKWPRHGARIPVHVQVSA
jgi:hypothetical protein